MVQLTAWLCKKYNLTEEAVIRHYDVTGKNCPKYFVEEEAAWTDFKSDVKEALQKVVQISESKMPSLRRERKIVIIEGMKRTKKREQGKNRWMKKK